MLRLWCSRRLLHRILFVVLLRVGLLLRVRRRLLPRPRHHALRQRLHQGSRVWRRHLLRRRTLGILHQALPAGLEQLRGGSTLGLRLARLLLPNS